MTVPDGFVTIESHQLRDLGLNIDFTLDEFSPFTDRGALGQRRDELIVDRYYGQAYHAMELRSAGIYGRTADLPAYSGDQLANHGFLRVPFRRIPRRVVHTRAEIEALLAPSDRGTTISGSNSAGRRVNAPSSAHPRRPGGSTARTRFSSRL